MIKLVSILKEIIGELADTNKSFSFHKASDSVVIGDDGYGEGIVIYRFETDNEIPYQIDMAYLPPEDDLYEFTDADGQVVDIQFSAHGGYSVINNPKELFPVMTTIVKCVKDSYDKYPFKYIIYSPTDTKAGGKKSPKGELQRTKLYDYYIKKEFPKSDTNMRGNGLIVTKLDK